MTRSPFNACVDSRASRLGASHILACGQPNIPIAYQSIFAWYMNIKIGELYVSQSYLKKHPHPLVNIYPIAGPGWKVFPSHVSAASAAWEMFFTRGFILGALRRMKCWARIRMSSGRSRRAGR